MSADSVTAWQVGRETYSQSSAMWPPADIAAVPTPQERINAKLEIGTVEIRLKDALLVLAQAQLQVDTIEKELWERKAWIAPVRYLSIDVLSLIFEFCGEDDWETPLLISEVSRRWRDIVLATPRAWAFLDLKDIKKGCQLIPRFFERSRHYPLHICLPADVPIPNIERRLKCLSINDIDCYVKDRVFPILDTLTIRQAPMSTTELSHYNDIQFPSLRRLFFHSYLRDSIGASSRVTSRVFPPLQVLELPMIRNLAWLSLLDASKGTLISLKLVYSDRCTIQHPRISLPVLKCLEVNCWVLEEESWPLHLVTPILEIYLESIRYHQTDLPHHGDTKNVKKLRSNHTPRLSSFPLLELLQLSEESHVSAVFSQLVSSESLAPNLQEVELEFRADQLTRDLDKELAQVNQHRPVHIQPVVTSYQLRDLPHAISYFPCGVNMPCGPG